MTFLDLTGQQSTDIRTKISGNISEHTFTVRSGEECLLDLPRFSGVSPKTVQVYAGIDAGSTQTRGAFVDLDYLNSLQELNSYDELFGTTYVVPSLFKDIPDNRSIPTKGAELWANMDSYISFDGSGTKFTRVTRGQKAIDVSLSNSKLMNSVAKVDNDSLYLNICDALGYGILQKYVTIPATVDLWISSSLPPEDFNDHGKNTFRGKMRSFKWKHLDYGITIQFKIRELYTFTEPEANVKGYYTVEREELPEEVLHIEGGGRNVSHEILHGGNSLSLACDSSMDAGSLLLDTLGQRYSEKRRSKVPSMDNLERSLIIGKLKQGAEWEDITDVIKESKDIVADQIFNNVMDKAFQRQHIVQPETLDVITFGGKLFDCGDYDYSITKRLMNRFSTVAPKTKFKRFTKNYIPWGLVLLMMGEQE